MLTAANSEALLLELAHLVGLVHALPAGHVLVEDRDDLHVGVQRQVVAERPDGERKPERTSSAGVWIAPHAATTSFARTATRWPRCRRHDDVADARRSRACRAA